MERITIEVVIVDGKTTFVEVKEELPLFQRVADLTETLGQYAGTIGSGKKSPGVSEAEDSKDTSESS